MFFYTISHATLGLSLGEEEGSGYVPTFKLSHWHGFLSWYQHVTAWALMVLNLRKGRTELQNESQYSSESQGDMA